MDLLRYNRDAWDRQVREGNRWTVPVGPEVIARARDGDWQIILTPQKPVPSNWLPPLEGCHLLCLASGGGQQGPVLAAAGALVTVFDNSPAQLAQDRAVAEREGLRLRTEQGDMADLSAFGDEAFDLIVHPCSNSFVPDVLPVWREAFRVLRPGGSLLAGMCNPVLFTIDPDLEERGVLQLKYAIPYSDLTSLTDVERRRYTDRGEPLSFGHSLDQLIGGQLAVGFRLTGFFDDYWGGDAPLDRYLPAFFATRSVKPEES